MPTDLLAELNPKQREAVETVDGPVLIVAGPGSGKTRVITHRIAYLVRVCGVTPYRIAAVTFTNKAAREMNLRLAPLLSQSVKDLTAGTFHSFCAMVLRRNGDSIGLDRNFAIYDDPDQIDLLKRSMAEVNVDPKRFHPRAVQSAISGAKSQLLGVEGFKDRRDSYFDEVVFRVYERYETLMTRGGTVDFDDLLMKTYLLFENYPDVADKYRNRYVHFMIDEFQDTNVAQYAIARQLSRESRNLCVVGDPDQSIYSWRNADIRNILSFQTDYPEAKVIALEENYRSTQTILDAARSVIAENTQRVEKDLWTKNGAGVPITVFEGYNEQEEAQYVVKEIANLTNSGNGSGGGKFGLGDIAVMYRVNAQSRALEEECLRYGVPYQVVGGQKFYLRQEVKDITAYLRLTANPHDDVSLNRVINRPTRGIGQRTLDELTRLARDADTSMYTAIEGLATAQDAATVERVALAPRAIRALTDFRSLIDGLASESEHLSLIELMELVVERTGYRRYLLDDDERGEERVENIQEYVSSARDFADLDGRDALTAFLESVSLVSDVDELEERAELVTLITLHQAKGLEYPVVFMMGMEEGLLPHIRSMEDPSEMEEERRLCYVGITRAKERLYMLRAFRRGFRGGSEPTLPSRFLNDIPKDLIVAAGRGNSRSAASPTVRRGPARTRFANGERPAAPPADPNSMRTGDKVRHASFGEGIVMSSSRTGADTELTIAFKEGHGVKRLLKSFAPLEKVD